MVTKLARRARHHEEQPLDDPIAQQSVPAVTDAVVAIPGLIRPGTAIARTAITLDERIVDGTLDAGRTDRLRRPVVVGAPGCASGVARSANAGPLRRVPLPKQHAGKLKLDTDRPEEFEAAVRNLKLSGGRKGQNDDRIKGIVDWLEMTVPDSLLIAVCQELWVESFDSLTPKAAAAPVAKKKTPEQLEHEKAQELLAQKRAEQDKEFAAKNAAKAAAEAGDSAAKRLYNSVWGPIYWKQIQDDPGGEGHGGSLKFLVENKLVNVQAPHRCFLSSYERNAHGQRDNNKFGLSMKISPTGARADYPGLPLVLHLHCDRNGKVLSGGIKYLRDERIGGGNILLNSGWVAYLRLPGVTGDNVEEKVRAFD